MVVGPTPLSEVAVGAVALYTLVTASRSTVEKLLALARYYAVPDVLVGMTVLALGTSLPEISAHVVASLGIVSGALDYEIASGLVLGGNMGSSTVQQTLLLGMLVVAYGRLELRESFVRTSYVPMLLAFVVLLALAWDGTVSRADGLVLLVTFLGYVYVTVSRRERPAPPTERPSVAPRRDGAIAVGSLVLVLLSASLLLAVAEGVVDGLRLGGSMVGVVTIGIAAALPELSTVLAAARRREPNLALGTLVGSNVVNPLVGVGLGGLLSGYYVPPAVVRFDLPFKIAVGVGLLVYAYYVTDRALTRRTGAYLVVAYFAFVSIRVLLYSAQ